MLREETKRLLFRMGGIWIALAGIMIFFTFFSLEMKEKYIEQNTAIREIADAWSGYFDGDRYQKFCEEIKKQASATADNNIYYNQLVDGEITYSEYVEKSRQAQETAVKNLGINYVKKQIKYVREKPTERQLLYDKGWIRYFSLNSSLFIMVPLILIFYILLCMEAGEGIVALQNTAKNGRRNLLHSRIIIAGIVTIVYICIIEMISMSLCGKSFALPHAEYSLQSLYIFSEYEGDLKIYEGIALKIVLEALGSLMMAGTMGLLSELSKNKHAGLLAGMIFIMTCMLPADIWIIKYLPNKWMDVVSLFNTNHLKQDLIISVIILLSFYLIQRYRKSESRVLS